MPDLTSALSPALSMLSSLSSAARYAVFGYAILATVLTTACLTLHAIAACNRRFTNRVRAGQRARPATRRPLFVRFDAETDS